MYNNRQIPLKYRFYLIVGILALIMTGCATIRPPSGQLPVERKMLVTGYCRCGECCGWKRNWIGLPVVASGSRKGAPKKIGICADGSRAKYGTIAADPTKYPFGTIMYVEGYGYGIVQDTGGKVKGEHIDIFFRDHTQAQQWGAKKNMVVKIWMQ
ncbi:MAG: 3D domain-containing protein [Kiritimatiellae bacterium]|nr:3D domain-containing protein [Kiritimatiellia bacterium]MDD5521206.1 3D domain-containing protein [Kiritimatiellia bacterium]